MKNGQFPEVIQLGDLNGQNGFKLDGENILDESGCSVSTAGDINGDGYADLMIGAYGYGNSGKGRSYVIFGGANVGAGGTIALSSLKGSNGFKLDGENKNDYSSWSVGTASDINGDGHSDLLIGAIFYPPGNNKGQGRSYVIFGGLEIGKSGTFDLSNLNGANGFKLDGENNSDFSGGSVSAAGDINGDGHGDLIIGAQGYPGGNNKGRSYVIFGGKGVGGSGIIALSSLNGVTGFKLDGENNGDSGELILGVSASAAGDINGDGHDDLIIGAKGYPGGNNKGRSYVIFGGKGVGGSGVIALSSLNGVTGFKLDGENNGDLSGSFVSAAGDINGDGHDDLIIGAPKYPGGNNKGRSYVIFGGKGIGGNGVIALSSLNGVNGFKLDGENNGDSSGGSVSAVGDINGDGHDDLIIGAPGYPGGNTKGRSYIVFGGFGLGVSGNIVLSSLNGTNGFKLDGENHLDFSGTSVSAAGDINGDGCDDMIISASGYPGGVLKGRTYVVFGDISPILVNNSLHMYSGETLRLTTENLAAYDRNHDNHTLVLIPSGILHGRFELINFPGVALSNFTQQAIINQTIQFVHDGSAASPAYNITVRSSGIAWTGPYPANITFDNLLIIVNQLIINQGQTITLTADNLQATYQGKVNGSVSFLIADLQHGHFEWTIIPGQAILTFQQQNITDGKVRFIHDGTDSAPAYQVSANQGSFSTLFQPASIDFDATPVLLNNRLVINQGLSVLLTSETLSATHPGSTDDSELRFDISVVQQGQFSWVSSSQNPLTSFYQRNITDGLVQFVHDNSIIAPGYNVTVTDGRTRSLSQAAQIDFDAIPFLLNNTLRINQGEKILITGAMLSATHSTGDDSVLLFNLTDIVHGQFTWVDFSGESITCFYQQNITDHRVQFVHDHSILAPTYNVSVTDGRTSSLPQSAQIDFDTLPVLVNNHLRINQGETVSITAELLSATHPGHNDDEALQFNVMDVTQGQFHWLNSPSKPIVNFYQQNITDGRIQFTHDNSTQPPAYQISVTDGRTISSMQAASIDFDASPILLNNTLVINQGQTVKLTPSILSATHPGGDDDLLWFNISAVKQGKFSLLTLPDQPIFSFYQQNITDGLIQFSHDNSTQAPSYEVSVSDGRMTLPSAAAKIDFDTFPILTINQLIINQGRTVVITADNLQAIHDGVVVDSLNFIINDCQYGQFQWVKTPDLPVTVFQQKNITDSLVQFTHDNSTSAPVYRVAVSDGRLTTIPSWSTVDFDLNPILVNNQLTIGEGETVVLTSDSLSASHNGVIEPNLIFIISNVINGGFIITDTPAILTGNLTFLQQQILDQHIRFSQQGSGKPGYQVSVTDGRITLPPASANVTFYVKPVLTQNQFLVSTGQSTVLTSSNLAATRAGEVAEDLQFLVSSVNQGHFEKCNNPGIIQSFYQKDVMQQNIQFVADDSRELPDCRLKVWDSSTDLSSDVQQTSVILVINNYFRMNQGDKFNLTENVLNATTNRGDNGDIVFTPITGTVQHGQFKLVSNPDYPLANFQQKQISAQEVMFVSENVTSAPSAYLTISDGQSGSVKGTVPCQIDFDAAPLLQNAYLSTQTGRREQITDINLKANSTTAPIKELIFEISNISNGYFADKSEWQVELRQFTQQNVTDGNIIFVTDKSGQAPQFKVSVWDGRMHCWACPQSADVVFDSSNPSNNSSLSDVLKNAIISAVASGVVGLLFFALKYKHSLNLQRNARPTIDGQEQHTYSEALLLQPIAREIFSRIKITGCLGYIGKQNYNEYMGAVSVIVAALENKNVIQPDHWNSLSRPRKQRIIDAIAMHTKELVGNNRCCSTRTFTSFYKAEATPRMIRNQAEAIAEAVQETLSSRTEAKGSRSSSSVRLTSATSSLNESQMQTPLLS